MLNGMMGGFEEERWTKNTVVQPVWSALYVIAHSSLCCMYPNVKAMKIRK
jgi:hypothetical protein